MRSRWQSCIESRWQSCLSSSLEMSKLLFYICEYSFYIVFCMALLIKFFCQCYKLSCQVILLFCEIFIKFQKAFERLISSLHVSFISTKIGLKSQFACKSMLYDSFVCNWLTSSKDQLLRNKRGLALFNSIRHHEVDMMCVVGVLWYVCKM